MWKGKDAPVQGTPSWKQQAPSLMGKTFLLIDDEPYILDIIRSVLEDEGCVVFTASDGREAIELYREHWRDIHGVLLDFVMPKMLGDQVYKHLKQINPNVRVLLVTGNAAHAQQAAMLTNGVNGVVEKPFYIAVLVEQVRKLVAAGSAD